MRTLRALLLLTGSLVQRLLRQGIVLRSLAFPVAIIAATLIATLLLMTWLRGPLELAVPVDLDPGVREALLQEGWSLRESEDLLATVRAGEAFAATDGEVIWTSSASARLLELERDLRRKQGSHWNHAAFTPPEQVDTEVSKGMVRLVALLYSLYGVVFGAGMVARDRDDGTLEAELALPVPRWVHGASRLLAGSALLALFVALALAHLHALFFLEGMGALLRNAVAAVIAAVAIGLAVVGRRGLKQGFSGPLALGLTAVTGMILSGFAIPGAISRFVPMASMASGRSGWEALAGAVLMGVVSVGLFSRFAARG